MRLYPPERMMQRARVREERKESITSAMNSTTPVNNLSMRQIGMRDESSPFGVWVFIEVLFYHLFFPLSIPVMMLVRGSNMGWTFCFYPTAPWLSPRNRVFAIQLISALFLAATITLRLINDDPPSELFIVVATIMYISHKIMISSKYAVLSESMWELIKFQRVSRKIVGQIEASSWLHLAPAEIHMHMRWASDKVTADLKEHLFVVDDEVFETFVHESKLKSTPEIHQLYKADLSALASADRKRAADDESNNKCDEKNMRSIGVRAVAARTVACVVKQAKEGYPLKRHHIILICVAQTIIPPIVYLLRENGEHVQSVESWAEITLASFVSVSYFSLFMMFLVVGDIDYRRRLEITRLLTSMISPSGVDESDSDMANFLVDMAWPENVASWCVIRQLLHEFGRKFRLRLTIYISYVTLLVIVVLTWLILVIYLGSTPPIEYLVCLALFTICVGGILVSMIYSGSAANTLADVQARRLIDTQFNIRVLQAKMRGRSEKKCQERLDAADNAIDATVQLLQYDSQINPIRVLGFKASYEMFTTFASLLVYALASAVQNVSTTHHS